MKRILFIFLFIPFLAKAQYGIITTYAGVVSDGFTGDGGPASSARLNFPSDVAMDANGNLFIADYVNSRIRIVDASGTISTWAGDGSTGCSGSGVPATTVSITAPTGIGVDRYGNLYVADQNKNIVYGIGASNYYYNFTGHCGTNGFSGDSGPASLAVLKYPSDVVADRSGNLFIADPGNYRIRMIDAITGDIDTYAGNGAFTSGSDGGSARSSAIGAVVKMAVDNWGNLFYTDDASKVRKIDGATGIVTTIAGTGSAGFSGDGGLPAAAKLNNPNGIAVDEAGNIYVADRFNNRIRKIENGGVISTVAGTGSVGYSGDGGPAIGAQISYPSGVCVDALGNVYFVDYPSKVRKIFYNASRPNFMGGATQTLAACDTHAINISARLIISDADSAQIETWKAVKNPSHGNLEADYFTLSSGALTGPLGITYAAEAGFTGSDTFKVMVTDGHVCDTTTFYVTVRADAHAGTISGPTSVCLADSITLALTVSDTGGVWSVANSTATVLGGIVRGVALGTDTIAYVVSNSCSTDTAIHIITINTPPYADTITGPGSVCVADSITLTDTAAGGTWAVTTGHASVSSAGVVTGLSAGIDTIKYIVAGVCSNAVATKVVTVLALPHAGTITGPSILCEASTDTLTDTSDIGTWTVSNGHASIVSFPTQGIITGVSAGVDTVIFTVTNACGTEVTSRPITINPLPYARILSGTPIVCEGSSGSLTDSSRGGTWSRSNNNVTILISSTGIVFNGIRAGLDTLTYVVTNSCGAAVLTQVITVNPLPHAGTITGPSVVCEAATDTLTDTISGGTWSLSNSRATILSLGTSSVVTGVRAGLDTVIYTYTNSCGTDVARKQIRINPLPHAGTITGRGVVCEASTDTLRDTTSTGTWAISNGNATLLSLGTRSVVTGVMAGLDTVSYSVTNSCGTDVVSRAITVNPLPHAGVITGATIVCEASADTLTDTASGGVWSVSNSNAALLSLGTSSLITGISSGLDTVFYSVTNSCGTDVTSQIITINPLPHAGTITGVAVVCEASTDTLTDTTSTGTWSISNDNATLLSMGTMSAISGVTAGMDTVYYSVTNSCGTDITSRVVTVNPLPHAGIITGIFTVCEASSETLTDTTSGGTWTLSNANASLIASGTSGVITGVSAGLDTAYYTVTNSCGTDITSQALTIRPLPHAGTITGVTTVCESSSTVLANAVTGGSWTITNANATISGSVVTGITAGLDTVVYTYTNSCGTDITSQSVTINPLPHAGAVTGVALICPGITDTLVATTGGGIWTASSGHTSIFAIPGGAAVSGISPGMDTITYLVTNSCGWDTTVHIITVNPLPYAGIIGSVAAVCPGNTDTLTASETGGTWAMSNANAIIVPLTAGSVVTGVTSGLDTVIYSVTNFCGTDIVTQSITVSPLPDAGIIIGATSICPGETDTLGNTVTGFWTATGGHVSIYPLTTGAVVTGISSGVDTITHLVTNSCGWDTAVHIITVRSLPDAGLITGPTTVCQGGASTLFDTVAGGTWGVSNAKITIIPSGTTVVLNGITAGLDTVYYAVSNTCGTDTSSLAITINPLPDAGVITGNSSLCQGSTDFLTDTIAGGSWSITNANASITPSGTRVYVTGVTAGQDTVIYAVTNTCGTGLAIRTITINPLPEAGIITGFDSLCVGVNKTLSDTSSLSGSWIATNANASTFGSVGSCIVYGVKAGTDTILHIVANTCGIDTATKIITINPAPFAGSISGSSSVCVNKYIVLTDTASGGVWSVLNSHASIKNDTVTGVSAGKDTVLYTVSNSCGSASASHVVTINPLPVAGIIAGLSTLCIGVETYLSTTGVGGTWSVVNANAVISSNGLVTGQNEGSDTVKYTVTNSCGVATSVFAIAIDSCIVPPVIKPGTIRVYPSPTHDLVTIATPHAGDYDKYTVIGMDGAVITSGPVLTPQTEVSFKNVPSGSYFLRVTGPFGVWSERIVKY